MLENLIDFDIRKNLRDYSILIKYTFKTRPSYNFDAPESYLKQLSREIDVNDHVQLIFFLTFFLLINPITNFVSFY